MLPNILQVQEYLKELIESDESMSVTTESRRFLI